MMSSIVTVFRILGLEVGVIVSAVSGVFSMFISRRL